VLRWAKCVGSCFELPCCPHPRFVAASHTLAKGLLLLGGRQVVTLPLPGHMAIPSSPCFVTLVPDVIASGEVFHLPCYIMVALQRWPIASLHLF